jgi:hypothetical protein
MRVRTLVLASILTSCLITPAMAEEMKPAYPVMDVQKRQDMNLQLQMMHQRQMNEVYQLQQRHMREVNEQNMKHMQEMQSMHQQLRSF